MLSYLAKYLLGLKDQKRIEAINGHLLYPSTPVLKGGILYLDGEGTASGYVAKRGAEIYLSGEFNQLVIGGSKNAKDLQTVLFSSKLKQDGQSFPLSSETESQYILRIFAEAVGMDRFKTLTKAKGLHIVDGTNTGQKIENARHIFEEDLTQPIQAVTLSYNQRRLLGTFRKTLGDTPVVSVEGVYPLGFTKENWMQDVRSYIRVMDEADKTGPRLDGKAPKFRKFFDDIDLESERNRIAFTLR